MANLINLTEVEIFGITLKVNTETFKIEENDSLGKLDKHCEQNCRYGWGWGQEHHSSECTPEAKMYKVPTFFIGKNKFNCIFLSPDKNDFYVEMDYLQAKYNHSEYDGFGKGFNIGNN